MWRGGFSRSVNWKFRISPGSAEAFVAATVFVVIAGLVRWAIGFIDDDILPYTTFYPAVLFATFLGGVYVGGFAAILGGLTAWWTFVSPHFAFLPLTLPRTVDLLAYSFVCALIIWGADSYRRIMQRLQDEENLRKLAVEELAHRLKNKLATMQSIISYQLREHPQLRNNVIGRFVALSATDDLIMAAHGRGASVRDIVSTELGAYEVSRTSMEGPPLFLPSKVALMVALLVHELATNAAKYGSLSSPGGKVTIRWSLSDKTFNLEWRESGGPIVTPPSHRGFGLRMMSRALDQFSGSVETTFERNGLICVMKAVLPESTPSIVPEMEPSAD